MFRRLRYRKSLVDGLGLAALVVPATALAGNTYLKDGRSPDTKDAAALAAQPKLDPQIVGYLIRYGYTKSQIEAFARPLGTTDNVRSTLLDGRSPDTIDFAAQAHEPVVTVVREPGFQWGDFGVGLSAALLVIVLLSIMRVVSKDRSSSRRPATSS